MWPITQAPRRNQDDGNGGGGGQYTPEDITPPGSQSSQPSPFQQRISELTGTIKEQKEMLAQQQAATQQLMATIAQMQAAQVQANRPAQPAAPSIPQFQIPEGMDPAMASLFQQQQAFFQAQLKASQEATQQALAQVTGRSQAQIDQLEFQNQMAGQTPEVQKLAQKLLGDWRAGGYTGWAPKDAITMARGMLGVGPTQNQPRADPSNAITPGGGGGAPVVAQPGGQQLPAPLPQEAINKMTLAQEEAYWRKRLEAQGGADQPLLVR